MIYHLVRFAVRADATAAQRAAVEESFAGLKTDPHAGEVVIGRIEDPHVVIDGHDMGDLEGGYTHAVLMRFDDEAAYERYLTSETFAAREQGTSMFDKMAGLDLIDDWDEGTPARIRALRAKRGGGAPGR